ncbi:hypothetical protein TRVA0_017S00254 [Trichomonascus vanleenenianus]|uniref:uncharacterized protein n=1 Tax=Trichomonascus vanleenenianus TaxID=2268995 RepID=UPI003ECA2239
MSSYSAGIQDIVEKRVASLEYLRKVHGGTICWLNTVQIAKKDFDGLYWDDHRQQPPLNALHFFYLGGSIPSIYGHDGQTLTEYLKAFLNVLKEYEILIGSNESTPKNKIAGVGRRLFKSRLKSADHSAAYGSMITSSSSVSIITSNDMKAKSTALSLSHHHNNLHNSSPASQQSHLSPLSSNAALPPSIQVAGGHEFSYLAVYHLPFIPDVYETFLSLCEALIDAYKHIRDFIRAGPVHHDSYELLLKVDDKLRKYVISPTVKDIDALSRSLIYEETTKLDGLLIQAK